MEGALATEPHKPNRDTVIGTDNTSCRWRLGLTVDGRLKDVRRGDRGGSGGSLPDEIPARFTAGRLLDLILFHKTIMISTLGLT